MTAAEQLAQEGEEPVGNPIAEYPPEPPPWPGVPLVSGRFPIFIGDQITVDGLRRALNAAGMNLYGDAKGRWVIDLVPVMGLVRKDVSANDAEAAPTIVRDPEARN